MSKLSQVRKALIPLVAAAAGVATQWLTSGSFTFDQEFVTAVFGVVTAGVVYLVPNIMSAGLASIRKALVPLGTAAVAVVVQWIDTKHLSLSQEATSAIMGVISALLVYRIPNAPKAVPAVLAKPEITLIADEHKPTPKKPAKRSHHKKP